MADTLESLERLVDGMVTYLLRPFVVAVILVMEEIEAQIRNFIFQQTRKIAKAMESDLVFLIVILDVILLAVVMPHIVGFVTSVTSWLSAKALSAMIAAGTITLNEVDILIDLQLFNELLRIFWPEYRVLSDRFLKAVSGLAKGLGEGSGFVHAALQASQSFIVTANVLMGFPPEAGAYQLYQDAAVLMSSLEDRYLSYARNPELIFSDIIDNILIPAATDLQSYNKAIVDDRKLQWERIRAAEDSIKGAEQSVDDLIESMPEKIGEQFEARWLPVKDWIDKVFEAFDTEIVPKVEGAITAFEARAAHQDLLNQHYDEQLQNALLPWINYELSGDQEKEIWKNFLRERENEIYEYGMSEVLRGGQMFEKEVAKILNTPRVYGEVGRAFQYEGKQVVAPRTAYTTNRKSWNVGEY